MAKHQKLGLIIVFKNSKYLKGSAKEIWQKAQLFFLGIIIIGLAFCFYTIFKNPIYVYLNGFLDAFFIILISTLTSLLASSLFSTFQELLHISRDQEICRQKKFQHFFQCEVNNDDDNKKNDKVTIVLPSYRYIDYLNSSEIKNLTYAEKEHLIKNHIKESGGEEKYFLNSIKIFFDSAAVSFSQSDAIAAANIVALFSKMSMRLPTIRTDLQSLSKIFQYNEEDIFLDENGTFNKIHRYLDKTKLEKVVTDEEMKKIIHKRANDTNERKYSTYISIGMFSNILLMDLLNHNLLNEVKKHFTCVTFINDNERVVRFIKINRHGHEDDKTPELLLAENEITTDYALIARSIFFNKIFFVCAGITVVATEAAARFLSFHWEDLHNSEESTFAIVIPIPTNEHKYIFKPKKNTEWWAYPETLKEKLYPTT